MMDHSNWILWASGIALVVPPLIGAILGFMERI